MSETVVTFKVTEYEQGFSSMVAYDGLLRLEGDALALELRETRTDLNTFIGRKSATIERTLPVDSIDGIEVRRHFFGGGVLELRTRSLAVLDGLPGCTGNVLRIKLPRGAVDTARSLAAAVDNVLADRALRRLEE